MAIKQWVGTVLGGCFLFGVGLLIRHPPAWHHMYSALQAWAGATTLCFILTFVLVVPYMFVVRGALYSTRQLTARQQQYALCSTAGLMSTLVLVLLTLLTPTPDERIRISMQLLPWVVAAVLSGWYVRP